MAQHFDVAVVGTQISGIIAAALIAKKGRRVLLVDHGENTAYYRRKGMVLPLMPSLVPSLETSPPVQRIHEALGLGPDFRAASRVMKPAFQAVMPGHRIDIPADREDLIKELAREFPLQKELLQRFFAQLYKINDDIDVALSNNLPLPSTRWRHRLKTKRDIARLAELDAPFETHALMDGIPEGHPVRELLLGPLAFFGHLWSEAPSTMHAVRLIARYFEGSVTFKEGVNGLSKLLLGAAERAGVEIRRSAVVRTVECEGRRLLHLELEEDRHTYTADFFISNTLDQLAEFIPADRRLSRFTVESQAIQPVGSLLAINLVVHERVIPKGMAEALFLLNGRRLGREQEEAADPPLFVRRYPAQRSTPSPTRGADAQPDAKNEDDQEVVSLACPVRVSDVTHSPERFASLRKQMIARTSRLIPFLDEFLVDTSLPVETASWDLEDEATVRRVDPWRLHPIYETAKRPLLGIAARGPHTAYKNLVHCGHDVAPGLGLEGDYIAGLAAAEAVVEMAGRKWKR